MKKVFFLLAIMFASVFSFGQQISSNKIPANVTNQEVASTIAMSKEANILNGVYDPNKIMPGQKLTFLFKNGKTAEITVEAGDNQWFIVKNKLSDLVKQNGNVVPFITSTPAEDKAEVPVTPAVETSWYDSLEIFLLPVLIALGIFLIAAFIKNRKKISDYLAERAQGNFATDNPMVAGGVSDSEAVRHMDRVAQRSNVTRFGPVTKGRLTTFYRLRVTFANGGRKMRLTNAHVFMSQARRNTDRSECWIAYVQTCGNDASIVDMNRATFVADVVQSPALRTANQPITANEATVVNEKPVFSGTTADLAAIITAVTSPMNGKDNGKLQIKFSGIEIAMEFSSTATRKNPFVLNGEQNSIDHKDQPAVEKKDQN
jgi:hypothetical protein